MLSFDTNLAVHAANTSSPVHEAAFEFLSSLGSRRNVAITELMLVELYLKLRNARILSRPMTARQASEACQVYRNNRVWMLIDSAPIMDDVWSRARTPGFAFRRIIDVRLGLTLLHHGVDEFATTNTKDFQDLGFRRVWDPTS